MNNLHETQKELGIQGEWCSSESARKQAEQIVGRAIPKSTWKRLLKNESIGLSKELISGQRYVRMDEVRQMYARKLEGISVA